MGPYRSLSGSPGILDGSTLDPTWNQLGSYLAPNWIHDGYSSAHLGTYRFFHGLSLGPEKAFGTNLDLIVSSPTSSFSDGSKLDPSWDHPDFCAVKFWVLEALKGFSWNLFGLLWFKRGPIKGHAGDSSVPG